MRKYVVPCAALLGIALLSPRANATVDLLIKSRAIPPAGASITVKDSSGNSTTATASGKGSVPIAALNATNPIWGIDAALAFDATKINLRSDNGTLGAFQPDPTQYDATKDVVVTGSAFVGTGTQPNGYVGIVKGGAALNTTANGTGTPAASIGLIRVNVLAAAGAMGGTLPFNVIGTQYNVLNTGDTTGTNRNGATAVSATGTPATLNSETVNVVTSFPGYSAPTSGFDQRVPVGMIALGLPGDVNADGVVGGSDVTLTARFVGGTGTQFSAYKLIAGDVNTFNSYVPGTNLNGSGNFGGSYGDGIIGGGDVTQLARYVGNTNLASFPVSE